MARRLFKSRVEFKVLDVTTNERDNGEVESHVTFDVTILEDRTTSASSRRSDDVISRAVVTSAPLFPQRQHSALIGPQVFCNLFPFHVVFDKQLVIRQCGANIQKLRPEK